MTTILPADRTSFDAIMSQLGHGLSQTLPQAAMQRSQRETGLSAIDRLQQQIQTSGGDINKILPELMRAYTQNQSLERSGLGQQYLSLAQRKAGSEQFPVGQTRSGIPTKHLEGQQQEVPVSVSDLVPARQSLIQNPQGLNDFQLPYGPEEISAIRQKARQLGYLPEMEERFVKDAQEYNQIAEQRRNSELNNYQQQQQQRRDTLENQAAFEKYLTQHSPEFAKNPDELELALKASEKYQNLPSFAERNAKVKEELRPYQASKKALEKTLKRPLFGQTHEQRNLARPRAQMMVKMGQKPQLQLMIANGGNGELEEADLLNPLPETLDKHLSNISKFVNPLEKVTTIDPDSPEYSRQLAKGSETRLKQRENMTNYLSHEIIPGTYENPGTNLLLVRGHLMNNNATWEESGQIIDDAIRTGKIKLDPQQKIDYQKLAYPPLTGDTYFDTVMNNIMFPITGKQ